MSGDGNLSYWKIPALKWVDLKVSKRFTLHSSNPLLDTVAGYVTEKYVHRHPSTPHAYVVYDKLHKFEEPMWAGHWQNLLPGYCA